MTRIRYGLTSEGNFVSKPMVLNEDMVVVTLFPTTKTYMVVSKHTGATLHEGSAESMPGLKMLVKTSLKALGMAFSDEVRKKVGTSE